MNDRIAKEMIEKMIVADTELTYEEMLAQQKELTAKLNAINKNIADYKRSRYKERIEQALQTLFDICDESKVLGYVEFYYDDCDTAIEVDVETVLSKLQDALQSDIIKGCML